MDKETKFFLGKLELDYGDKQAVKRLKKLTRGIGWLKGWPEDKRAFWDGEAFMWRNKISKEKRRMIKKELGFLRGGNLDLGCGSYSYVAGSVGFDISEKMLLLNENLGERVVGDLEGKLLFGDRKFDSATLVFVLDYVKNYADLLSEVYQVLKEKGRLLVVQPAEEVGEWQRQKRVNKLNFGDWRRVLESAGFGVKFYEKEGLGFFRCLKGKII